jgi:hypothetical protein
VLGRLGTYRGLMEGEDPEARYVKVPLFRKNHYISMNYFLFSAMETVILENCIMYNSFNYLHCDVFQPNKIHHLIQIDNTSDPSVEAVRIAV